MSTSGQSLVSAPPPFPVDGMWSVLRPIMAVAQAPLTTIAERLFDALLPYSGGSSLVIFTEDCTGRPQKKAGDEGIISRVSIPELQSLRASLADDHPWYGDAEIAAQHRPVLAMKHAPSNALLVIADPYAPKDEGAADPSLELIQ